jgi:hypothetical protein
MGRHGGKSPGETLCDTKRQDPLLGQDGALGRGVVSLYEHWGSLWVGAATGLWQWKPGPSRLYPMPF